MAPNKGYAPEYERRAWRNEWESFKRRGALLAPAWGWHVRASPGERVEPPLSLSDPLA